MHRPPTTNPRSRLKIPMLALGFILASFVLLTGAASGPGIAHAELAAAPMASGWTLVKFPQGQPACTGVGFIGPIYYDRLDCGFGYVAVTETDFGDTVEVTFIDSAGDQYGPVATTSRTADDDSLEGWQFTIRPGNDLPNTDDPWAPGKVIIRVTNVNGVPGNYGETSIFVNQLGATVGVSPNQGVQGVTIGDYFNVAGEIFQLNQTPGLAGVQQSDAPNSFFKLRVIWPDGTVKGPFPDHAPFQYTTGPTDSEWQASLPPHATAGLTAGPETNFQTAIRVEVIDASQDDPVTRKWGGDVIGAGAVTFTVPPDQLVIENSFVSSVGWVKPGETYPFRVFVRNYTAQTASNINVTIPNVDGATFTQVAPVGGSGTATINSAGDESEIVWNVGALPAAVDGAPSVATLVVEARADTLGEDPQIVWKDLSSTAVVTYNQSPDALSAMSHGPKVIPVDATYDSARYGDRPFPVVPVDYFDRKHDPVHTGEALANKINSPFVPGSTFNLFQEMSLGQLFPHGTVPSAGLAGADFNVDWKSDRYQDGQMSFSQTTPQGACAGAKFDSFAGEPGVYEQRIVDGWYQLPGDTNYYGGDRYSAGSLGGAIAGVGAVFAIDDACGPTGKAVYDAAHIADPEIDYNDFDTDKDGVVDFFMMVFVGTGGNGASQTSVPPYDNIWPHSSSLEFYFTDPETGLTGYISDDQLKSLTDVPQCWLNDAYQSFDDCAADGGAGDDSLPVYVRVGPYNVNPEDSIDRASVISHEYGHSLGLPDFYSLGSRDTYGDWNLMASDKSQHMDVFGKQELGWVVPVPLPENATTTISGWGDSKIDTGEIHWVQPDGTPYTLSAANGHQNIHNAEVYVAKLPSRLIIDPSFVAAGGSPDHVWWSGSGNDFGCPPIGGHNFDVFLPELANAQPGDAIEVSFKTYFDIEWDYDYGFVLAGTPDEEGKIDSYSSLPSLEGYTTATSNPNANGCQAQYGNGLTGTSASFDNGTSQTDRVLGNYPGPDVAGGQDAFLLDRYDLSAYAGQQTVLRFSYATDPGLARPGWFIDDLQVTVNGAVVFASDFETEEEFRFYNGGCAAHGRVAETCTLGWKYVSASAGSPADHAYYLEMRDRSGFDFDGKGESDRGDPAFAPGLLLVKTDESHGYGNVGTDNPPAQSPVDALPSPGDDTPNLDDAAFNATESFSDFDPTGWVDNYDDPNDPLGEDAWRHLHNCLSFTVDAMSGDALDGSAATDLVGDVTFTLGDGCGSFNYGLPDPADNKPPTAVADARPLTAAPGETVTFDGSGSYDDFTSGANLAYAWDFDGDGVDDATGQTAAHSYADPGVYTARLTVTDEGGLSATDTVTITVTGNHAPDAVDDDATVAEDGSVLVDVLANDSDPDNDPLILVGVTAPGHGTAVVESGQVRYTPDPDYNGPDAFTYTITDGDREASAVVDVTVNPVNDQPTAVDDSATVNQSSHVDIDVLANDSDPDGDALTVSTFTQGSSGTVTQNTDGTLRYTHDGSASTADSFTYSLSDGEGGSDTATVTLTIDAGPPDPTGGKVTGGGWLATLAGQKLNIGFNAHDKGAGGLHGNLQLNDKTAGVKIHLTDLTYIGEVGANCGAISAAANAVEFQGDGAYNGAPAAFRVCVVDGDEPGGDGQDRFYLECVSGCGYSTSARVADNGLDGGNIKLHQAPGSSGAAVRDGGTLTAAKGAGLAFVQNAPAASVLILNPLLMTDGVIGLSEDFTVEAYDVAGAPLAGVAVTLVATAADGSTQTLTTFSGADGLALFTVAHLSGETEYIAYDGALSSNAIAVTGLLP